MWNLSYALLTHKSLGLINEAPAHFAPEKCLINSGFFHYIQYFNVLIHENMKTNQPASFSQALGPFPRGDLPPVMSSPTGRGGSDQG